jgi:CHAD domain-containing protein
MIGSTHVGGSHTADLQPLNGSPSTATRLRTAHAPESDPDFAPRIARPILTNAGGCDSGAGRSVSPGWRVPAEPGACLARALRSRLRLYRQLLHLCQHDFSEHSVHQLRVASRRLIALLVLLSSVVPGAKTEKARKSLKRRLKILGELRDAHVQRDFISHQWPRYPELVLVVDLISRQERRLTRALARKVQEFKFRKVEKCTVALCVELRASSDDATRTDVIASNAYGAMAEAFAEVARRRQAIDPGKSQTIHRTRLAFKEFRYIVESLSPAFTGLRRHQLRRFATYQRRMGFLQDLEILQAFITRFVKEHAATEPLLRPFIRYLGRRRARALCSVIRHADDLFVLWRLAGLDQHFAGTLNRTAA